MIQKLENPAFYLAIIGGAKLVSQAFGYQFISDQQTNDVANGLAALVTVAYAIIQNFNMKQVLKQIQVK